MKETIPSSAIAAAKTRRFRRVIRADGRSCLVAIDHAAYMGAGPPLDAKLHGCKSDAGTSEIGRAVMDR